SYGEDEVNKVVLGMVASALLVVGVASLIRALFLRDVIPERYAMHLYRRHIVVAIMTGAVTGFVIGLTSAGSGTLIALVLIAGYRLTPQRVVGTDVFHAAILLWAAGIAHWVGGNVDLGLAANILVGSIPGVLIGSQLAVKVPTGLLRNALGIVLIASSITLITKEHVPRSVLIPSISVAALAIGGLFAAQIGLHRQRQRQLRKAAEASATAG
ncbi:MAG: sulfite exporter TauE/SafE family protein, partial [Solirubrobacterales bacterium]